MQALYKDRLALHEGESKRLKQRGRKFGAAQLAFFLSAIGCAVGYTLTEGLGVLWSLVALAMLLCYVVVRRMDEKNDGRLEKERRLCAVYRKELAWLVGDFSSFDDGARYVDPHHEYTFDMDVFGSQSLYHRLCRCATRGGADSLARLLSSSALGYAAKAGVDVCREAVGELENKEEWRADFMSYGVYGQIDTDKVAQSVVGIRAVSVSKWFASPLSLALACVVIVAFYAFILLAIFTPMSASLPVWCGIAMFFSCYALCGGPLRRASEAVGNLQKQMSAYVGMMQSIVSLDASAADNVRLKSMLGDGERGALSSLRELGSILSALDRRGNLLGTLIFDVLFLSDFFLVRRFLRWQCRHVGEMSGWLEAVSEMDARVSMATYCYVNQGLMIAPAIVEDEGVVLEARAMSHPFLGRKAVPNDFALSDGHFYIVTGANMAGKSTFLRSLGVNYILAMAGMPVFARGFRVSVFSLFCSMRTSDDLAHGISYFNAELLRLKQLLDLCRRNRRTLIILDEILKGTNSQDKLNGSRMFLEAVSKLPVTGVIATHDLELSKMSEKYPMRFHNHCFEIGLSEHVTYTYKITEGVARNQNATFLLRGIIG